MTPESLLLLFLIGFIAAAAGSLVSYAVRDIEKLTEDETRD